MKARAFSYVRPTTVEDALGAYAGSGDDASYIAGGQSLVPALAMRLQAPSLLVDISHIETMKGIALEGDRLRIGALTRHFEALSHPLIRKHAPLLSEAAPYVAHPAIRNKGTLGGSVALADPASEFPAMMLALGAEMEIAGPGGTRRVAADDFFLDLYQTALEPGELLVSLHIPVVKSNQRWAFDELARRRGDYAIVGAGVILSFDGTNVSDARIVFISVGATPIRAKNVETALAGQVLDTGAIQRAQAALENDLDPPDDKHMTATMRMHLARVLLGRLLHRVMEAA
ncbi:MAG: xanthine dehydrogenase family protein subunit M [Bradyrhizobiaceae bacterium]|nr:MAG: xanthine dehydrogenase family protein subunit M [Bradyrhizobiaceae bacterium]